MLINLKVKTLDARTHEFSIDNELTIRQFKDQIAEKTNIAAENQRIIYQGRVLADDKQVKEYDVDGKVLHVAERPPFSQRGANARNNDEPMRTFRNVARPPPPGMRTSPYFRALDGMLVGTMAIPVNNGPVAGQTRPPPNRYPNSSSFCINRITVALHMIDCADNIAAYLENPAVGLNNQSLDILQRGRWSMESTVVEVGVSSTDLPRNNNIIDMVQDAVTAALSRTGARNYTVVQLPTVYTNENGETSQQRTGEAGTSEGAASGAASNASGETTAATVIIEDVIETDDEAADGASDRSVTPTPEPEPEGAVGGQPATAAETPTSSAGSANDAAAEGAHNSGPRRRTRPQVLAQVIQHYRGVQARLAPFVDRYYEILQNDPTFEESDTSGRENAQRIFDRVSEAFHYLSHAQHAISDLMLDLSQPGPRVLTCRPILVEQSGYIRSNNIFTPNFLAPASGLLNEPFRNRAPGTASAAGTQTPNTAGTPTAVAPPQAANLQAATDASRSAAAMAEIASRAAGAAAEMAAGAASAAAAAARDLSSDQVEDPVDEPMVAPNAAGAATPAQQQQRLEMDHDQDQDQSETPERENRPVPRLRVYVPVTLPPRNTQMEMARIIQAMVNGQRPNDVHVEFNAPNVMSINLPVHVMTTVRQAPAPGSNETAEPSASESSPESTPATATAESPNAASTSSGTRSGDQRANTLPTTSTQTRSTSRPQIQIGGNNNWGGRIAPTHTAFDRFLPCNSHHIREPEQLLQNNNTNRSTSTAAAGGATVLSPTAAAVTRPASVGSAVAAEGGSAASSSSGAPAPIAATTPAGPPQTVVPTSTPTPAGGDSNNLRSQLRSFLNDSLFVGVPINEQTIPGAIGRALEWFAESLVYLPQYERPEYNSRDSVCNILRVSLRLIIELCNGAPGGADGAQFEQSLKKICDQFRKRLYSVLFLCLGSANAELYWRQLMRLLCTPMRSNFRNEALQFLCIYIDPTIPAQTDTADAQQFLVLRSVQAAPPTAADEPFVAPPPFALNPQQQQQQPQEQSLDTDVEMAEVAASSSSSSSPAADLPVVIVGSEPWHMSFPNDWLPVITRDLQTQAEQSRPQPPFSDAYISGMSAKRRKIIQSEKPTASVECLIANGVQRAIQSAGLGGTSGSASSSSISMDTVIGSIAHDSTVQAAYTDAVRNSLKERIKQDADFKSSKYPQIAKFAEQK
ncbi:large proline-rich protein BAG6 isoform X8 [Drosophila santomea]|uniref:large proline-rich protein BAG6 isoform X8 n=1 Tax=Drosophila santomea TaxID=129105 RepID=UPI001952D42D|nr:large proline-rich protein BAG6 isoform X8 [Drosophila santomea]